MRQRWSWLGRAMVLGLCAAMGCQSPQPPKPYPPDPLLESKQPAEKSSKSPSPFSSAAAALAPRPPLFPPTLLVSPADSSPLLAQQAQPGQSSQAASAEASEESSAPPVQYGHAADYRWLVGVIEKHYQGKYYLRYCDVTAADRWGGKVCLEPDARLGQFADGEVVHVEGVLVCSLAAGSAQGEDSPPRYFIRAIRPVHSDSRQSTFKGAE